MFRPFAIGLALAALASTAAADKYAVRGIVLKLPRVELPVSGAPVQTPLAVPGAFTTRDMEEFCGPADAKYVPLAKISVLKDGRWSFKVNDPAMHLYLQVGHGCLDPIDGDVRGNGILWARVPGNDAHVPAQVRLDIALPAKPHPVEVALGDDLTTAVSARFKLPRIAGQWQPIVITATTGHFLEVHLFGGGKAGGLGHDGDMMSKRMESGEVHADQPFEIDAIGDPGADAVVVVTELNKTVPTIHDVYGAPPPGASVGDHALSLYGFFNMTQDHVTRDSALLTHELFMNLDPAFFVYGVANPATSCGVVPGEPLLLFDANRIAHANGLLEDCRFNDVNHIADVLTTKHPAKVTMPAFVAPRPDQQRLIWEDEDFLVKADTDKGIAAYKQAKARAAACSKREWDKRDPNRTANRLAVVSFSHGKVSEVQNLGDKLAGEVYVACRLEAIAKQRDAIYARLAKEFEREEKARLVEIAQRLGAP